MKLHDLHIDLSFSDDVVKEPESLLAAFDEHGFAPTRFNSGRSRAAWIADVKREIATDGAGMFLFSTSSYSVTLVSVLREMAVKSGIGLDVSMHEARIDRLRALVVALCNLGRPVEGFGHGTDDFYLAGDPREKSRYEVAGIHDAYWLLVLGKEQVSKLGKKHVLATPAFEVVALRDGGAVIFTTESPLEPTSAASRQAQAKALAHLVPEQTVKKSLARYAKRDAALAPVEKQWDPAIAPLYELIADWYGGAERQEKIRELNARKLPAVTEVRAKPLAENAKPMRFKSIADDLVAMLHDRVRGLKAHPDSRLLPQLDWHFFREDYPETYGDAATRKLLEPLGAWLGEAMRLELGGTWVPRAKLEENQLVVGKTAYLPFQRVAHFLASKDAAIDYSLTRYFAHAAAAR